MPYDMCNVKPPTVYANPLKEFYDRFSNNDSNSTIRAPYDRYDTTGGSFPVRPSHCNVKLQPSRRGNEKTYIARYLRSNLLATNPVTLCAVKNTRVLKSLMEYPPLEFVPAKFARGPCRSTTHLELDATYERTLCAIQENLRDEQKNLRAFELQKRAQDLKKFVSTTRSEQSHDHESFRPRIFTSLMVNSKSRQSHETQSQVQQRKKSSIGTHGANNQQLIDICKKGDLLAHVRQNVARRIENMEFHDKGAMKHILPTAGNIAFHIDESRNEESYEYPSHGAMASMCTNKRSANVFYESKSVKELHHPKSIYSDERVHKLSMPSHAKHAGLEKGLTFSPSLFENVSKAAPPSFMKKTGFVISRGPRNKFSHLGLIEGAKADIVKDLRGKMDRREPVQTPKWLATSHYGPLKYVPENPLKGPLLPLHLAVKHCPPTEAELERVERLMAIQKAMDKEKRRLRVCKGDAYYTPFSKPLLTDSEDEARPGDDFSRSLRKDYKIESETLFDEIEKELDRSPPKSSSSIPLSAQNITSKSLEVSSFRMESPTQSAMKFESKSSLERLEEQPSLLSNEEQEIEDIESIQVIKPAPEREEEEEASSEVHLSASIHNEIENFTSLHEQQQSSADRLPSKSSLDRFAELSPSEVDRVIKLSARNQIENETGFEEREEDLAFSDVAVPKVQEIQYSSTLYKKLLSEHPSSSSDNSEESSDHDEDYDESKKKPWGPNAPHNEYSLIALLDDDDYLYDDDYYGEEEGEQESLNNQSTTFKTSDDDELSRRMKELLGPHAEVDFVFRTDPTWRKLTSVEKVPKQIHLRDSVDPRGFPPRAKLALFDYKAMREEARVLHQKELDEQLAKNITAYRTSVFGTYVNKGTKAYLKSLKKTAKSKKSIYELTPASLKRKQVEFFNQKQESLIEIP